MELSDLLVKFLEKNIASKIDINVIGDAMVDEYYNVEVNRISPEFPIPVYKSKSFGSCSGMIPGGAANVAYQFKYYNVDVQLISLLNNLSNVVFNSSGIKTEFCKIIETLFMPTKRRLYCDDIPLNRWDFERENYGLEDIKKHLLELKIPDANYNIFSDYAKGIFSIPWFRKYIKNTPSIVDPKNNFIDFWEDCTIFKPNAVEAKSLSDKKDWKDQIEFFMDFLRCKGVVITQSGDGVVGKEDAFFEVRPEIRKVKSESVIGAGDCFVSHLSMALARNFTLTEACEIAFAAGTLYVQRKHNKPISPAELLSFVGVKELKTPELLHNRNFTLAFTNGCFDFGLTSAHVQCLEFAKKQCSKLIVGLNSDASISRIKGKDRPILQFADRAKILSALNCVDYIVEFDEDTPIKLIGKIIPDVIVKGGDYKKEEVVGNNLAPVKIFNYVDCMSTTQKIKKLDEIEKYFKKQF